MKKMMTILMGLFLVAAITNVADAQTSEQEAQFIITKMQKSLNLTDDQKTQVNTIILEYAKKMEGNVGRSQSDDVRHEYDHKLQAVLKPWQYKRYLDMRPRWSKEYADSKGKTQVIKKK